MEYPFKDLMPLDEVLEREGYYKDWTHLDPEVFYSLTQISEYIKTKGYGVDVRLLIAQLAEHFGLKTTQVVVLANLLQHKFDNLEGVTSDFTSDINGLVSQMQADKDAVIANVTVDSEVILARGGKPTLQARLDETTAQFNQNVGVSPITFGAVGDGLTDDTEAILATFNFAKLMKSGVTFGNKTYVFNPSEPVKFPYWVSYGSSKIIRTNRLSENIPILELVHEKEKVILTETSLEINKKTIKIPELAGYGNAYVQVFDSTSRIFKRKGVTGDPGLGVPKFDQFTIDNNGNVLDEITVNFDNITEIIIQPMDDYTTVISGGEFLTDSLDTVSMYYKNGIVINKSNVVLENIHHNTLSDASSTPTDGFIVLKDCANIRLRDVSLSPRVYNPSFGTYDISLNKVLNVDFENVNAPGLNEDNWGVMGGNFVKNLKISKSNLNRVDGHMGITNLELIDTTLGRHGLSVVGFGKLIIRNLTTYAPWVINLRKDYGAFWEGKIDIEGIRQVRTKDEQMGLINAEFNTDFDYGQIAVGMGTEIIVDNYSIDNKQLTTTGNNHIYNLINLRPLDDGGALINEYLLPESISITRAKVLNKTDTKSGFVFITDVNMSKVRARKSIANSDVYKFDTNVKVSLSDIDFADFSYIDWRSVLFVVGGGVTLGQSGNDDYGSVLNRPFWGITINNSNKVHINLLGRYVRLKTNNSTVSLIKANNNGCRSWLDFHQCKLSPRLTNSSSLAVDARFDRLNFSQTEFSHVYIGDDSTIAPNPFVVAYKNVLDFTATGGVITALVNCSGCYLNPQINLSSFKTDLNRYDFTFNQFSPYERFHMRLGSVRPTSALVPGLTFYDTSINKLLIYDGTAWRDSGGNPV